MWLRMLLRNLYGSMVKCQLINACFWIFSSFLEENKYKGIYVMTKVMSCTDLQVQCVLNYIHFQKLRYSAQNAVF